MTKVLAQQTDVAANGALVPIEGNCNLFDFGVATIDASGRVVKAFGNSGLGHGERVSKGI